MQSRIIEIDAPRKLSFTWNESGDVTFALEPKGDKVLLTVTHRRLADRNAKLSVGAGWHMHLDMLVARMNGTTTGPFWDGWQKLKQDYDKRMPA
jgi:uncharacterized protein YndB with AHSA1/START domain